MLNKQAMLLLAGFLSLATVMGIGRFAYTPIFPYMQMDALLTSFTAGLLSTFNYIGYLIGALLARVIAKDSKWLLAWLIISVVTTFLMGTTEHYTSWALLRLVSGVASGMVFVLASSLILSELGRSANPHYSGIFYGGVGFGIALSGLLIPTIEAVASWQGTWLALGGIGGLFFVPIALTLAKRPASAPSYRPNVTQSVSARNVYALYISYALQGLGYIIFGTFITALLVENPEFTYESSYVWTVVGIGAIPSCLLFAWLGQKIGEERTLKTAYLTQIISILIPVLTDALPLILLSALGFGATFMGITTLTMTIAKRYDATNRLVGGLTAAYATGQLIGPALAGGMITANDYTLPFVVSAIVLIIAWLTLFLIKKAGEDRECHM